jgi:hypothetical protein
LAAPRLGDLVIILLKSFLDRPVLLATHSRSSNGVRLHFQIVTPPREVNVGHGGPAFLVAVDVRKGSPTPGNWVGVNPSGQPQRWGRQIVRFRRNFPNGRVLPMQRGLLARLKGRPIYFWDRRPLQEPKGQVFGRDSEEGATGCSCGSDLLMIENAASVMRVTLTRFLVDIRKRCRLHYRNIQQTAPSRR